MTKLFYKVESLRSSPEIHETREEAIEADNALRLRGDKDIRVTICEVKNYYKDGDRWNYENLSDTFNEIVKI